MLCLADALFTADGNPIGFVAERRTAGLNPKQIVYEITVPAETKNLMLYALAKTGGGTNSKGTITVSYQPSNENGNDDDDDNGNDNNDDNNNGNDDDNENQNGNNENENQDTETSVTEQFANINIYVQGRTIVVENATDEIFVYNTMGRLVGRDVARNVSTITLEKSGIYIVKIGNLAKKIFVE